MILHHFSSESLDCAVNLDGAELWFVRDGEGRDWQWDGDPAWWTGRAPILFPVIGVLNGGGYRYRGKWFALEKHGFARRRQFAVVDEGSDHVLLRLDADEATRASYPFDFRLDLRFSVAGRTVLIAATVENRGADAMPFSFGFHPALRWPLPGGSRDGATLSFDGAVSDRIWRMNADGLLDRTEPCPAEDGVITVRDQQFTEDAMIFRDVAARATTFDCGGPSVRVEWDNLPDLGIWTKPGAPYLCIEPWQGFNDPVGFDGEIEDKPGIVMLAPGETWRSAVRLGFNPD